MWRLTKSSYSIKAVNNTEVVKLGAVIDNGITEGLKILIIQNLSYGVLPRTSGRGRR